MFTSTTLLVTQNSQCSQGTGRLRPTCQKSSHSKLSDFCRPKRPVTCVCRIFPKAKELYSYYRVQSGAPLKSVYKHTHKAFTEWTVFLFRREEKWDFFVPWQCYNIVCRVWSYAASATGSRGITHLFLLCSSSSCSFINTFQKTDLNNFQNLFFPILLFTAA